MDFIAYHDRTSADHQTQFDTLFPQGYRMISLGVYGARCAERHAAVWVRRAGPAWSAVHGLDRAAYLAAVARAAQAQYKPLLLAATGPAANPVFAAPSRGPRAPSRLPSSTSTTAQLSDNASIEYWIDSTARPPTGDTRSCGRSTRRGCAGGRPDSRTRSIPISSASTRSRRCGRDPATWRCHPTAPPTRRSSGTIRSASGPRATASTAQDTSRSSIGSFRRASSPSTSRGAARAAARASARSSRATTTPCRWCGRPPRAPAGCPPSTTSCARPCSGIGSAARRWRSCRRAASCTSAGTRTPSPDTRRSSPQGSSGSLA